MKKMAVLGCGNMAKAIFEGLVFSQQPIPFEFFFYNPTVEKAKFLAQKVQGQVIEDLAGLPFCDYYLIACKPQKFSDLVKKIKGRINSNATIISIMAAINVSKIQQELAIEKIIRIMPNTPCAVAQGVSLMYCSPTVTNSEQKDIQHFFDHFSQTTLVTETQLDILSCVTCLGPAYLYQIGKYLVQSLQQLGVEEGIAQKLTRTTLSGSGALLQQTDESLSQLIQNVASKGGMTEAALKSWESAQVNEVVHQGIKSALKKIEDLNY